MLLRQCSHNVFRMYQIFLLGELVALEIHMISLIPSNLDTVEIGSVNAEKLKILSIHIIN